MPIVVGMSKSIVFESGTSALRLVSVYRHAGGWVVGV